VTGKTLFIGFQKLYTEPPPVRDSGYLRWVRTFPCSVCKSQRGIEAAHTGPHGIGQKSSDQSCIPLCRTHHRELHARGPVRFQNAHLIQFEELTGQLNALWEERKAKAAA
jgi:hypothetical protein